MSASWIAESTVWTQRSWRMARLSNEQPLSLSYDTADKVSCPAPLVFQVPGNTAA